MIVGGYRERNAARRAARLARPVMPIEIAAVETPASPNTPPPVRCVIAKSALEPRRWTCVDCGVTRTRYAASGVLPQRCKFCMNIRERERQAALQAPEPIALPEPAMIESAILVYRGTRYLYTPIISKP